MIPVGFFLTTTGIMIGAMGIAVKSPQRIGGPGVLQRLHLRSSASVGWRYLVFWVLGLVLGVVVAVPVMMGVGTVFGNAIRRLEEVAPEIGQR